VTISQFQALGAKNEYTLQVRSILFRNRIPDRRKTGQVHDAVNRNVARLRFLQQCYEMFPQM
jgi:hypothetical protein